MKKLLLKSTIHLYSFLINGLSLINKNKASEWALDIFKTPRGQKLNDSESAYLERHQKGIIDIQSHKISYYNWPEKGKRILLLHGWESNSYRWRPYLGDMQEMGLNVFALDAPAHGLSSGSKFSPTEYASAIKAIVEKERINIILGHSVGGYSTIIYASENNPPSDLTELILLAPTGKLRDFMKKFFDFLKLNSKVRLAFENNFIKTYNQSLEYFDSNHLIKNVKENGLLIHDKEDATLPFKDSIEIDKNWKGGKFIPTEGYGHRLKGPFIKNLIIDYLRNNIKN